MKLQIKFEVADADNTVRKVSKTFSKINTEASQDDLQQFVLAFSNLNNGTKTEAYLIKVESI